MELNYKEDVAISSDDLDVEWLRQPSLYMKYAEELAYCNDQLKRAEQRLKLVRSDLILDAKEGKVESLGAKPSDAACEAYYRSHVDHQDAKEDYFKAAQAAEMAYLALQGISAKKTALENLVKLLTSSYFASPKEPRNLSAEFKRSTDSRKQDLETQARTRIKDGLNASRKDDYVYSSAKEAFENASIADLPEAAANLLNASRTTRTRRASQ